MARGSFSRSQRVSSLVHSTVAEILTFQVKDPRVAGVTVTDVEVTGDLREAKVFYYVAGDDDRRAEAQSALERAAGYMRRELGQRLQMRNTPALLFRFDGSMDYGAKIEARLRELGLGDTRAPGTEDDGA